MGKKRKYTKEFLAPIVKDSKSVAQVLKKIGVSTTSGGAYCHVQRRIDEYGIDRSHFVGQAHMKGKKPHNYGKKKPLEEILVVGSEYQRGHLKERLLSEGLKNNKCEICGQDGTWMGKRLVMVLDHVNGVGNDNRFENLRMLCPNCNSQQPTFCRCKKPWKF